MPCIHQTVNKVRIQTNPKPPAGPESPQELRPVRRRLTVVERESQLIKAAIAFFSENGFGGQLRDLARSLGVTHTLLYHYFPTKQALIDRIYVELFEDRWRSEWAALLDDPLTTAVDKFLRFYDDYLNKTLNREFVRILMYSALTDHSITDRYFAMLRKRLFPRLIRETRRHCGTESATKPTEREMEHLIGLHGGLYYSAMRRWVYGQDVYRETSYGDRQEEAIAQYNATLIQDRVNAYPISSKELFGTKAVAPAKARTRKTPGALATR